MVDFPDSPEPISIILTSGRLLVSGAELLANENPFCVMLLVVEPSLELLLVLGEAELAVSVLLFPLTFGLWDVLLLGYLAVSVPGDEDPAAME